MMEDPRFTPSASLAREKFLNRQDLFEDNFKPEVPYTQIKLMGGDAETYDFQRVDVRKLKVGRAVVYVAVSIDAKEVSIKQQNDQKWIDALVMTTESIFSGSVFFAGDNQLIELIDEKTGKITYIYPPDADSGGKKFNSRKSYKVFLRRNRFSGKKKYEFVLMSQLKTDQQTNDDILKRVAESV